jgi:CO/xanthine dehydrogenase FAD-binding subunit
VAVSPSDLAPALIALEAKVITTRREIKAEDFFAAGPMKSTILDPDEIVTEIQIPLPQPESSTSYLKFRLRQSIDFPIISLASFIKTDSKKVQEARLVLGAAAPVPLRMKEAEDFIRGKEINQETAEAAAAIAVQKARPLTKNDYKIQIAKTLIKRALLAALG